MILTLILLATAVTIVVFIVALVHYFGDLKLAAIGVALWVVFWVLFYFLCSVLLFLCSVLPPGIVDPVISLIRWLGVRTVETVVLIAFCVLLLFVWLGPLLTEVVHPLLEKLKGTVGGRVAIVLCGGLLGVLGVPLIFFISWLVRREAVTDPGSIATTVIAMAAFYALLLSLVGLALKALLPTVFQRAKKKDVDSDER